MEPTAAEQLANAQAAVDDAQTKVVALTATSSPADRAAAFSSLAAAQAALAEASGIPENEIALLTAEIARLQGVVDQAATDAQVEADRIAAEMTAEATRIAALVAGTKTAVTKEKAITAEAGVTGDDDAGLGGLGGTDAMPTTENQMAGEYNLAIKHGETSITVEGADADDDVEFMQAADLGHGRTMHVLKMDANEDGNVVTEVVIVATDIEAPKAVAFAKWKDMVGMTTQEPDFNEKTTDQTDFQSLSATKVAENPLLVKSAGFFASAAGTLNFTGAALEADDADDADVKAGTYNGAPGTYRCNTADDCTVMINDKGAVEMLTGWIFTPNAGATSDQPDYDYLNYGFWLKKTADADGAVTYIEVQTFAGSSITASDVSAVTGSATYNGGATGVYVHSEVNSDGSRVATTAGQFSADASLTAYFGQTGETPAEDGTIAPNLLDTLSGTIDNFALENNEVNAWAVNLQGNIADDDTGTASGSANGGGLAGTFSATFHGPTEDDTQPTSVVGEFGANFSNGSVAGAFGARK